MSLCIAVTALMTVAAVTVLAQDSSGSGDSNTPPDALSAPVEPGDATAAAPAAEPAIPSVTEGAAQEIVVPPEGASDSAPRQQPDAPATNGGPAVAAGGGGEAFDWSWDAAKGGNAAAAPADEAAPAPESAPAPQPGWDATVESGGVAVAEQPVAAAEAAAPVVAPAIDEEKGAIDAKAYAELVNENLDLRKKIADASQDSDVARKEKDKLAGEVKAMEGLIAEFAGRIKELEEQKTAKARTPEQLSAVDAQLTQAQGEKARLTGELQQLRQTVEAKTGAVPAEAAEALPSGGRGAVAPGSDLYREMERENSLLRQALQKVEFERQQAVKERNDSEARDREAAQKARQVAEEHKALKQEFAEVKSRETEQKRLLGRLMEQMPNLEKGVSEAETKAAQNESELGAKQRELETLKAEIEKREDRLRKAERMAAVLSKARDDVRKSSDKAKRDMHYNMAAVYAKEGRFRDAEQEYLAALRMDPNDADVHYNLGILYDDDLNERGKAVLHYKKYLKLNPHGNDADSVRSWLMNIDMNP